MRKHREDKTTELHRCKANCLGTDLKMELLLPLLLLVTTCAASPRDMSGKMFNFPQETNKAHVRLTTSKQDFSSVTVCHRSFTDLRRNHGIFSMSMPRCYNAILTYWIAKYKSMSVYINNRIVQYQGLDYKLNKWLSVCTTWNSTTKVVQMWFDGQPLTWKHFNSGSTLKGSPIIVLGQDQDIPGGGFHRKDSFVGMLTDVHMWDYVLSQCEIQKYMDERNFTPGNVINWSALEFQIVDRVLIEDKAKNCV